MATRATPLFSLLFSSLFLVLSFHTAVRAADLLSPEERLWLSSRGNTIIAYPEKNNPPFSYQSTSGAVQGLSIDYLELIAEKVGAKIQYLTPRSRSQIIDDAKLGKGDVLLSLTPTEDRGDFLRFTDSYATVSMVIVIRKDVDTRKALTLADFSGKRVAIVEASAAEDYVRKNYPRVIVESVTDNEVGLQQVVLGEVDAAIMDAASLSYLLSKQVLTSVKIGGDVGFDATLAFAVPKSKEILQSILEKGLSQISTADRALLADKWVSVPETRNRDVPFFLRAENGSLILVYGILAIGFATAVVLLVRRRRFPFRYFKRQKNVDRLKEEMAVLEGESAILAQELKEVKEKEQSIAEKINTLQG